MCASGGEDDALRLWDAADTSAETFSDSSFKDSVTHVAFSHDGGMLAAADMAGVIRAWKVQEKKLVWEFETGDITVSLLYGSNSI